MEHFELNTLVATEVMGFEKQKFKGYEGYGTSDGLVFYSHFSPSNDIQDAWKVVEKLKEMKIDFMLKNNGNGFMALFSDENIDMYGTYESEKPEVAICMAALKIVRTINEKGTTDHEQHH